MRGKNFSKHSWQGRGGVQTKGLYDVALCIARSLMQIRNKSGPNMDPWGIYSETGLL